MRRFKRRHEKETYSARKIELTANILRSRKTETLWYGTLEKFFAISFSKCDINEINLRHFEVLNALGKGSGYWLLTMNFSHLFPHELIRFQRCGGFLSHHCSLTHARSILPNQSRTRCPHLCCKPLWSQTISFLLDAKILSGIFHFSETAGFPLPLDRIVFGFLSHFVVWLTACRRNFEARES